MAKNLSEQDALFVMQALPIGIAEIKMSEVAADYASDPRLKQLAQQIMRDHSRADRALMQMVRGTDIELPDAPDAAHEKVIDKLWSLEGSEFDRAYVTAQLRDHEQALRLFEREARNGRDPALKRYAQECLPVLQERLRSVQDMAQAIQG